MIHNHVYPRKLSKAATVKSFPSHFECLILCTKFRFNIHKTMRFIDTVLDIHDLACPLYWVSLFPKIFSKAECTSRNFSNEKSFTSRFPNCIVPSFSPIFKKMYSLQICRRRPWWAPRYHTASKTFRTFERFRRDECLVHQMLFILQSQ